MNTKDLVRDALLAALLFIAQVCFAWLPNIELVSLLLILYTMVYKRQVWLMLYVFILLEGLVYGFGIWWISYLYVWPILPAGVFLLKRREQPSTLGLAIWSGCFGMLFGLFCSVSYLFMGGPGAAFAWWVSGIPFDILHGIGNFLAVLLLYKPLYRILSAQNRL